MTATEEIFDALFEIALWHEIPQFWEEVKTDIENGVYEQSDIYFDKEKVDAVDEDAFNQEIVSLFTEEEWELATFGVKEIPGKYSFAQDET